MILDGVAELSAAIAAALDGPCAVPEGTPIVAACSGGADSVALVHGLGQLQARWPTRAVVYVDHGLRDGTLDRAAAARAAQAVGAPFEVLTLALSRAGNLQNTARKARLAALETFAAGTALVATGHTATDQAETVLQRLIRGAGLRGLSGIPPRRDPFIRPMLAIIREATQALDLGGVDDPTNGSDAYLRNRLRRHVLPLLREENPKVVEALAELATNAREELAMVDALLGRWEAVGGDPDAVDLSKIHPDDAATWLAWRLRRARPSWRGGSKIALKTLGSLASKGRSRGHVSLGRGLRGTAHQGRVTFDVDHDCRVDLVAWGLGSYRRASVALTVAERPLEVPAGPHAISLQIDADATAWPLKLGRSIDPNHPPGGWQLSDGAGRQLWRTGADPQSLSSTFQRTFFINVAFGPFEPHRPRPMPEPPAAAPDDPKEDAPL